MGPIGRKGLSLAEAIIALFILVGAFLVVIALFHSGLRYTNQALGQQLAVVVADKKLEEIRAWAQTPTGTGFNFDDWTPYQNVTGTDPDYPDYTVAVNAIKQTLYSPSSTMESLYFANNDMRALRSSVEKVKVTVSWSGGQKKLAFVIYVAEPIRALRSNNPVVVSSIPNPVSTTLSRDATQQYDVYGYDNNSNKINDIFFVWNILPGQSNGTLVSKRDGSVANISNYFSLPGQPTIYLGGSVLLNARMSYAGTPVSGNSTPQVFAP